ncbi:conjugal transfer protein [Wolbachia endosymbiont of Folsomia candida]|nr:conjugal transfer protein [Wolbachia endosymbiont of Folsomia candida]
MPFPRCISADYFGPNPISVSAHFPSDHDNFIPEDKEIIDPNTGEINYGFHHNQVVRWEDTGLETNGDSLVVRANGAWTSWSDGNKKESKGNYSLQDLEKLKYATKFEGRQGDNKLPDFHLVCNDYKIKKQDVSNCSGVNCKFIEESGNTNRGIPCWFTNGHGAYLLFRREGEPNPNQNLKSMRNPSSPTIHLGYNSTAEGDSGVFTLDRNSNQLKDLDCNSLKLQEGWKIYVKILDGYYLDNAGGYSFEFLGGVQQQSNFGFFDDIYKFLKCVLLINKNCQGYFNSDDPAAAQAMFENIVKEGSSFHNFVLSLLVLFVVISSLLYLFGMVQDTKQDMLVRMMKIALVVMLLSPGSFEFFYNHFLILFVEGLEQLIKVITNFSPNANTKHLFGFMENMFWKFFSDSVWKKFAAFLHYQMWLSALLIPLIFIGIVLYFLLCLYAFIIFLTGFMGIAFLIAIMPLFLVSILFSKLKDLFEGWIKFCISFCLKSVMIFTLLSLLGAMVMDTFYRQLGFTVCYNKWFEVRLCIPSWMGGFCIIDKQYFGWTPGQVFVPYTIGEASSINIDESMDGIESISRRGGTVKFTGGAAYIPLPPDYIEKGFRYIDYPFFNPVPGTQNNPADHYIAESDIVVNGECDKEVKDLVRLTNSLSHAVEKFDILLLIDNISKKIDEVTEAYCRQLGNASQCTNYRDTIKKVILQPSLKNEIKSLTEKVIESDGSCKLEDFYELNKKYQDNRDYQIVKDIDIGDLLNVWEIVILFLLSFLMFSLRKLVQEMGSGLAGGGYSAYSTSSMYQGGGILSQISFNIKGENVSLMQLISIPKHSLQGLVGGGLESLGKFATGLPNKLAGGTAHLLGRIPIVGGVFEHAINVPRKLVNATIEATKFATSPENDVDRLEEKIYRAFGVDKEDITHRKIDKYLDYYKGYVGSHLGYTIEDAMKFTWKHGLDSMNGINPATGEKDGYQYNLLHRAKSHREAFLEKLHDHTIGRTRKPEKHKKESDNNQSNESSTAHPSSSESLRATGAPSESPSHDSIRRGTPGSGTTRTPPKRKAPSPPTSSDESVRRRGLPTEEPDTEGDN